MWDDQKVFMDGVVKFIKDVDEKWFVYERAKYWSDELSW
jgi:hypothetical protein